jgi:hypothetical protein
MMDHAEYCGPIKELLGKTALVKPDETYDLPLEQRTLQAQFDGKDDWRVRPDHKLRHPITGAYLCNGWHTFPVTHFKLLVLG